MSLKIIQHMQELLKKSEKFCDKDGNIFVLSVLEAIENIDIDLVKLLLSNEKAKEQFFTKVEDIFVLNQNKLIEFFTMNEFSKNSYTSYTNKIGLIKKDSFIKKFDDVVLAWPHKDCILEGGQNRDNDKKNEVFYNEILSRDEIDRLFEPKALTNIKNFSVIASEVKQSTPLEITENDNLIIKGNNLIALHSLKKKYAGKVKLIYIDPPYNTGSDSFGYNDSFNHATWLTFMKNRLEIAKNLLREDGVIAVHCSFHEYAYLKVLMDELFTTQCGLCTFNIQVRHPNRVLTGDKEFNDVIEYILLYSKDKKYKFPRKIEAKEDGEYVYNIVTKGIPEIISCGEKQVEIYLPDKYEEIKGSPNSTSLKTISVRGSLREKNSSGRFYVKYLEPIQNKYPAKTLFKVPNMGDDIYDFRYFHSPAQGNKNGSYYQGKPTSSDVTMKPYPNFYNFEREYNNVASEGDVDFRNGKKPEELIAFLIKLFTKSSDIILDYHLGSGTTCAVAHKMNRRYIGIEQMDYIEDIAVERLKKVIEGEQGGISKALNWSGGGSFIYAELKQIETFKDAEIGKLNKNMHYLPFAEIEDAEYGILEEEIKINKRFYGLCDE
ncbi:MAG: site-specific DNA-methyltransferase [Sulfurimonas sp.]|uniref:DNA methyltransferase n=1 Tax=Sulfurimonas sp. TaxID=2022749 RepID=UPI002610A844|nr:site-specific DNA-methyltransferase [Sulfurimonas sp.]MDD5373198.1 site-specific DNA-methyltransferase [Sulfurimonas sp.]